MPARRITSPSIRVNRSRTDDRVTAVIIMLTWLWLSSLAPLFAAEVDGETERTRATAVTA